MRGHFPAGKRLRNRTGSFLLPAILVLITVLFLMAMTRNYFSRQQLNMSGHLRDYEQAYQMAASGMTMGVALFDQTMDFLNDSRPETFPKKEKAPEAVKGILQGLLDDEGLPFRQGASLIVDRKFVSEYGNDAPEAHGVRLTVEMRPKESLFPTSADPGFRADDREISYDFFIHAEGNYGVSSARMTTFFEGRFVNILPPVLGKFSLFIREQPTGGMNQLSDSLSASLIKNAPITVTSGELASPQTLIPGQVGPLLEKQGWVFLGGLAPWRLNMSQGGGNPHLCEGFLRSDQFRFPFLAGSELGGVPGLSFCVAQGRFCKELREASLDCALSLKKPESEITQSSLIHLCGSVKKPSPTLVFGNVSRRWVLLQGLYSTIKGGDGWFPFLDPVTFASSQWPGDGGDESISDTIRTHFNDSYEAYAKSMSEVFEEDFNASNLYALKLNDTDASSSPILTSDKLPVSFSSARTSPRMSVNNSPADYFKMNVGSVYELKNTSGNVLFSGGDLGRIEDLSFLTKKAGLVFENEREFWQKIPRKPGNQVHLEGVVLVKGNLTIANPLAISSTGGGMLLCTGTVWVKSAVQCGNSQPLSIVSLASDIWVESTSQVNAALIAMNGQVHLPKEFVINGLVATKYLDIPIGSPDRKREINYQSRFDPSDADTYVRSYRMMTSRARYSFVH